MPPALLTPLTPEERTYSPEPNVYIGLVHELRFDPFEPWYPCGCDGRFEDAHESDCWLGWIRYPKWMTDDTQVIDGIGQQLALVVSDVDDEDESTYHERHDAEPRDDDLDEEVAGGDVRGASR